jgi:protein-S-isoprenylcysteine O-methyltransferase Ste14
MEVIGKPAVNKLFFVIAKASLLGNIMFVFLHNKVQVLFQLSNEVQVLVLLLLFVSGALVLTISLVNLGSSLRVGLPKEQTTLKTNGLYAITRNPIYLGAYLLCAASCLFVPHWLNFVFFALVVLIHHQIILGEEKFLAQRFGKAWVDYAKKVRRYI